MKVTFHINYYTQFGETLHISGSIPELGSWEPVLSKQMEYISDSNWTFELELPDMEQTIEYSYSLYVNNNPVRKEWNRKHSITLQAGVPIYNLIDYWEDIPSNLPFYSSAFTQSVFAHLSQDKTTANTPNKLIFQVFAPRVEHDQCVVITGNQACLGNWELTKGIPMQPEEFPSWTVELPADQITFPLEYKFFISRQDQISPLYWENSNNRILPFVPLYGNSITRVSGLFFRTRWNRGGEPEPLSLFFPSLRKKLRRR